MLGIDNKSVRIAWSYALVGLSLFAIYKIREAIVVFVLALMFAYLLYPLVEMTQRLFKLKSQLVAVALPFAAILLMLAVGGFFLQGSVVREAVLLNNQLQNGTLLANFEKVKFLGIPLGTEFAQSNGSTWLTNELRQHSPEATICIKHVLNALSDLFIVPILAFFMLKDGKWISECLLNLCFHPQGPRESITLRRVVERIMNDAHSLIQEYMRSLVLLCFSVLIVFSIVLSTVGVKYAIILAVISAALEFIPMVGPLASGVIIVMVSDVTEYHHLGLLIAFLFVFRIMQDYMLSPLLMRHSMQLHPLLVVFGAFAGAEIAGVGGVFLSVPLLALSRMAFYEFRKFSHARLLAKKSPNQNQIAPIVEKLASTSVPPEVPEVATPQVPAPAASALDAPRRLRNRPAVRPLDLRLARKRLYDRVRRPAPALV